MSAPKAPRSFDERNPCDRCDREGLPEVSEFPNPDTGRYDERTLCWHCRPARNERTGPRIAGVQVRRFATSRIGWRRNAGGGA